jgi:hypothetical protein
VVSAATVRIDHLSAYESNLIRLTFQGTLNMFLKWDKVSPGADRQGVEQAFPHADYNCRLVWGEVKACVAVLDNNMPWSGGQLKGCCPVFSFGVY